jgi:hypothetical protein
MYTHDVDLSRFAERFEWVGWTSRFSISNNELNGPVLSQSQSPDVTGANVLNESANSQHFDGRMVFNEVGMPLDCVI